MRNYSKALRVSTSSTMFLNMAWTGCVEDPILFRASVELYTTQQTKIAERAHLVTSCFKQATVLDQNVQQVSTGLQDFCILTRVSCFLLFVLQVLLDRVSHSCLNFMLVQNFLLFCLLEP